MNNPNNPFVPKGTLLDLQERRRKQLKIAVFCAVSVGVVGLTTMLGVQGCKREKPPEDTFAVDTGLNTNLAVNVDTNSFTSLPPLPTNSVAVTPPMDSNAIPNLPPMGEPLPPAGGSEYKIQKGDTLAVIAKKNGVSLKALEAANPKLDPKHLKIGVTVTIPAAAPKAPSASSLLAPGDGSSYVVKHGDTLGHIAKAHGTTVNAIKAANNLKTDRINLGQKLIIPSKAAVTPVAPVAPPVEPVVAPPAVPPLNPPPK